MKTTGLKTIILALASIALLFSDGCTRILDRPPLTVEDDDGFWTDESKVKSYAYGFYTRYFPGYGSGYGQDYSPNIGYTFNDDMLANGSQEQFDFAVPTTRGSVPSEANATISTVPWLSKYSGSNWYFGYVRRANIMLDRVNNRMASILNDEQKSHWSGVARFFRAMEYAQMVQVFGDVPYFDRDVAGTELDELYKPRTPRDEVMEKVYDDLRFAMENVRTDDGILNVNRHVVAAFAARLALFEGTWQKYHLNNSDLSKKFLNFAIEAADIIRKSGKYDIKTEFRALFTSENLSGNPDVVFFRHYGTDVKHAIATSCNFVDGRYSSPNLALLKSFICCDGSDWQTSTDADNRNFEMSNLIKTRDPRLEATFYHKTVSKGFSTYLYITKFIPRGVGSLADQSISQEYTGNLNVADYPVMRYAEVLLNWIEAKAELNTLGGDAVTQVDIDASINKIRHRPIAKAATDMGVKQTADLKVDALPESPDRGDVPQLIWEIRRERRMEFAREFSRLSDLRRWKKLEYMDPNSNADIMRGAWIDANSEELKEGLLVEKMVGIFGVTDLDGKVTVYDGENAAKMVGFYSHPTWDGRKNFLGGAAPNPYLSPMGIAQQRDYRDKGYVLKQTEGWPTGL